MLLLCLQDLEAKEALLLQVHEPLGLRGRGTSQDDGRQHSECTKLQAQVRTHGCQVLTCQGSVLHTPLAQSWMCCVRASHWLPAAQQAAMRTGNINMKVENMRCDE
jgi:hypothetical protein